VTVDKIGRSPKTGQNVTNVSGVSHEYVNSNFLRKGQAIDMSGQSIVNLGSPRGHMDTVRKKYEKFFKRGNPIDMDQKAIKNVLPPTEEGDQVNKSYVDSKTVPKQWIENNFLNRYSPASTMAKDLNMDGHRVSYLRDPEQNHRAVTKGYADTTLLLLGGSMQGEVGMSGNRISQLGKPVHNNNALRLSSAYEFYLKRDGSKLMRNDLSVGGFGVKSVANPRADQDGMNLRTLQASATSVLDQATATANTAVGDVITNHANILNRDIRAKSLNLDLQGTATRNFSMSGQYHIAGLPDPTLKHEAVNLRTLNQKVLMKLSLITSWKRRNI